MKLSVTCHARGLWKARGRSWEHREEVGARDFSGRGFIERWERGREQGDSVIEGAHDFLEVKQDCCVRTLREWMWGFFHERRGMVGGSVCKKKNKERK